MLLLKTVFAPSHVRPVYWYAAEPCRWDVCAPVAQVSAQVSWLQGHLMLALFAALACDHEPIAFALILHAKHCTRAGVGHKVC